MIKKFKDFVKEGFTYMTSNDRTENEKYTIGQRVKFKHYINEEDGDDRPYKFVGEVVGNEKFNKLDVVIVDRIYGGQVKNKPCPDSKYRVGNEVEVYTAHVGGNVSYSEMNMKPVIYQGKKYIVEIHPRLSIEPNDYYYNSLTKTLNISDGTVGKSDGLFRVIASFPQLPNLDVIKSIDKI